MRDEVRAAVERALDVQLHSIHAVAGGDINEAWAVELSDGRSIFVKTNPTADATLFEAEAHGLQWLAQTRTLRVPNVIAVSGARPAFLVLENLGSGAPRRGFDEELGRGLAQLHRAGAAQFGLDRDNFIGRLPQDNRSTTTWAQFYRQRRLEPMLQRAERSGLIPRGLLRDFDRLFARLEDLVGPEEPPSRLHGDLWGGNHHVAADGAPCLIDPAVYGGYREVDLAMMKLFGGFGSRVFDAYEEAWPLPSDHADRVPLYQLYPLLVHVNLFGDSYVGSVRRALSRYV